MNLSEKIIDSEVIDKIALDVDTEFYNQHKSAFGGIVQKGGLDKEILDSEIIDKIALDVDTEFYKQHKSVFEGAIYKGGNDDMMKIDDDEEEEEDFGEVEEKEDDFEVEEKEDDFEVEEEEVEEEEFEVEEEEVEEEEISDEDFEVNEEEVNDDLEDESDDEKLKKKSKKTKKKTKTMSEDFDVDTTSEGGMNEYNINRDLDEIFGGASLEEEEIANQLTSYLNSAKQKYQSNQRGGKQKREKREKGENKEKRRSIILEIFQEIKRILEENKEYKKTADNLVNKATGKGARHIKIIGQIAPYVKDTRAELNLEGDKLNESNKDKLIKESIKKIVADN